MLLDKQAWVMHGYILGLPQTVPEAIPVPCKGGVRIMVFGGGVVFARVRDLNLEGMAWYSMACHNWYSIVWYILIWYRILWYIISWYVLVW